MTIKTRTEVCGKRVRMISVFMVLSLLVAVTALGHGGKRHGSNDFTAFQALQKAAKLYDRLLDRGKLGESWETELAEIRISTRNPGNNREFVVSFHRLKGDPKVVYIFFTDNGQYAGSNFTGE